jgi:exopolysaccharide biosynthesis polyprenyl glycosylphosphotransferase
MNPSAAAQQTQDSPNLDIAAPLRVLSAAATGPRVWLDWGAAVPDCILAICALMAMAQVNAALWHHPLKYAQFVFCLLFSAMMLLTCASQCLYDSSRSLRIRDQIRVIFVAAITTTAFLGGLAFLSSLSWHWFVELGEACIVTTAVLSAPRMYRRLVHARRMPTGKLGTNVLIAGVSPASLQLARFMEQNPDLGYRVLGFLSDSPKHARVLGGLDELGNIVKSQFVDEVFITGRYADKLLDTIQRLGDVRATLRVIPEFGAAVSTPIEWKQIDRYPVVTIRREPMNRWARAIKRLIDIVGSAIGLLLVAPLLALIAIAIRLDSPGPVLFRATRVGRKANRFTFLKFRTMVVDAEQQRAKLLHLNKREGPFFKIENDPRITRVGRFLRRYSLDELPQLWHVLRGDMSLVGPRPHPLADYSQYELDHLCRLNVTPGLTGLWQVTARKDPSWQKNISLDREYIENWSLWLDFRILCKTIPVVLLGAGE